MFLKSPHMELGQIIIIANFLLKKISPKWKPFELDQIIIIATCLLKKLFPKWKPFELDQIIIIAKFGA